MFWFTNFICLNYLKRSPASLPDLYECLTPFITSSHILYLVEVCEHNTSRISIFLMDWLTVTPMSVKVSPSCYWSSGQTPLIFGKPRGEQIWKQISVLNTHVLKFVNSCNHVFIFFLSPPHTKKKIKLYIYIYIIILQYIAEILRMT